MPSQLESLRQHSVVVADTVYGWHRQACKLEQFVAALPRGERSAA